jgi:hypothetical protein
VKNSKICPKCSGSTPMREAGIIVFLPALRDEKYNRQDGAFSQKAGIPACPYECPKCHLVELYHEEA